MNLLPYLAALALSVTFLSLDPAQTLSPSMAHLLRPTLVAIGAWVAMLGAGGVLLERVAPEILTRKSGFLAAFGLGMAICWVGVGLLACVGFATGPGCSLVFALMASSWAMRPALQIPKVPPVFLLLLGVLLLPGLVEAFAPRLDTDELYYHLSIPRLIAESGQFIGGFDHPDGSRPLPIHLIFAALYGLGGENAAPVWHWLLSGTLVLAVYQLAEERFGERHGIFPALALLSSWTFAREAGLAYNNLPVALWILLAAEALLDRAFLRMALFCGLALSAKYTAAAPVLAILTVGGILSLREDGAKLSLRRSFLVVATVTLPILPWLFRNWLAGLHPLFPYAGWPEGSGLVFMYNEKYGMGRDFGSMLLLPWNLLMHAHIDSFAFLGRISLLWAGLGAGLLFASRPHARTLGVLTLVGFVGWAMGPHWLRYLLPLAGLAALAGGACRPHPALALLWLASLPANWGPCVSAAMERIPVVSGQESRETFLERNLPAWPALEFLQQQIPIDAPVALLFSWHGYYVNQPFVLGSVEDHVPTRFILWRYGDQTLPELSRRGIEYLLVGENVFSRREFSFLSEPEWNRQFASSEKALDSQLVRDGVRLFRKNGFAVWRLPPKIEDAPLDGSPSTP